MSTAEQRAMWAFDTEYRAEKARRAEVEGLYRALAEAGRVSAMWEKLATDLIRNGARLPKT